MPYDQIKIDLLVSESREPNQIIALKKSSNEEFIAVISGKKLIMDEIKAN
jgi:hypothetical protein